MDIPELDEMIIRQLNLQDLSRCRRVSKKWNHIFIPYLWRDLTYSSKSAVAKMMLEDYLIEQQHHNSLMIPHGEQHASSSMILPPSPLAKYGHWIRMLPDVNDLPNYLESACYPT
ncbi:MAG: hypothetical protein J3Q66DRAFT_404487 [Benniella sp.]|nr:MAG: hypothetical protein J3Q66DRAFT_404487 [Benniella sp.]